MTDEQYSSIATLLFSKHQAVTRLIAPIIQGPTVFLFDEYHSSPDLIRDNVQIAGTLIQEAGVTMIAVEGIEGDRMTRRDLMSPNPDKCFGSTHFALAMVADTRVEVIGVDSWDLFREILKDCEDGKYTPANHPLEEQRSAKMLQSVLEKVKARPAVLAVILNGGTRHNDDIERLLRATPGPEALARGVSFIRIRSKFYPAT
jgi:hypothetical protein